MPICAECKRAKLAEEGGLLFGSWYCDGCLEKVWCEAFDEDDDDDDEY